MRASKTNLLYYTRDFDWDPRYFKIFLIILKLSIYIYKK